MDQGFSEAQVHSSMPDNFEVHMNIVSGIIGGPSPEPFHLFHRMSGPISNTENVAVDIDLKHRAWRVLRLRSFPSNAVNLIAANTNTTETLLKNGTWNTVNHVNPHLYLPELQLQMPRMYDILRVCEYEPFLKVFRTDNMTAKEITEQSNKDWTTGSEANVVMRTASFGFGQHELQVCARKRDYLVEGNISRSGLGDDMIVPLALLAVSRLT